MAYYMDLAIKPISLGEHQCGIYDHE